MIYNWFICLDFIKGSGHFYICLDFITGSGHFFGNVLLRHRIEIGWGSWQFKNKIIKHNQIFRNLNFGIRAESFKIRSRVFRGRSKNRSFWLVENFSLTHLSLVNSIQQTNQHFQQVLFPSSLFMIFCLFCILCFGSSFSFCDIKETIQLNFWFFFCFRRI